MNQGTNNLLGKPKRGRPRKDRTPKPDINMVGKRVTGVVEGTFEAGYFINVKVKDINLRGVVFIPGKVTPITSENDVAPLAKMYRREEIKVNQTADESLSNDQLMKDAVTTDLEMVDSARALSLVPQDSNGELAVQAKEYMMEKDGDIAAANMLIEFHTNPRP